MTRVRNAPGTRKALLEAGFGEIRLHGFQAAGIERILRQTGLTKGAFFHHFPTKKDLGYAVVDEVVAGMITGQWVTPLTDTDAPLATMAQAFAGGIAVLETERPILGCPLNNIAQEMSPIDTGFQQRTQAVFDLWLAAFRSALANGQRAHSVRPDVDPDQVAFALVAQIEGTLSLAKNAQDPAALRIGLAGFRRYLDELALV